MHILKFRNWNCNVCKVVYSNHRTAICLTDVETGEPILTATVNIPEEVIEKDEVIIKNYSENEGILDTLVKNKIVSTPIRFVNIGYVTVPICKLLI